jgi:hypothetical protein
VTETPGVHGRHVGAPPDEPKLATRPEGREPAHRAQPDQVAAEPVLPRSPDDSDVGWGGRADGDDDERLLREVPPHWQ